MLIIVSSLETVNELETIAYRFISFSYAWVKLLDLLHDSPFLKITLAFGKKSQKFDIYVAIEING